MPNPNRRRQGIRPAAADKVWHAQSCRQLAPRPSSAPSVQQSAPRTDHGRSAAAPCRNPLPPAGLGRQRQRGQTILLQQMTDTSGKIIRNPDVCLQRAAKQFLPDRLEQLRRATGRSHMPRPGNTPLRSGTTSRPATQQSGSDRRAAAAGTGERAHALVRASPAFRCPVSASAAIACQSPHASPGSFDRSSPASSFFNRLRFGLDPAKLQTSRMIRSSASQRLMSVPDSAPHGESVSPSLRSRQPTRSSECNRQSLPAT